MRTLVVANRKPNAVRWCIDNGVKPYSKNTTILTRDFRVIRGLMLGPEDRIVVAEPLDDPRVHRWVKIARREAGVKP